MVKKQIVCDTDVMIDYWNTNSKRHSFTKQKLDEEIGLDNIIISAITKMELLMGAANKSEEIKIKKKLNRFNTALINNDITLEGIELFERYRLSHGLRIPDCLIAATAKILDVELYTYNLKDFQYITKLKLLKLA
jgi:predicted nucleic acid-binding protein